MVYELLEKVFYKYPSRYEEIYQSRFSSESAYKLPIKINGYQAFFVVTNELLSYTTEIYKKAYLFAGLVNDEFFKPDGNRIYSQDLAKNKFLESCLINELILTNDIEGIKSTRKDILKAIEASLNNDKKVRLQGMVNKYLTIINNDKVDFMACSKIRKLYDEFVSGELNGEDIPDGEIFRKNSVNITDGIKPVHHGLFPERQIIEAMEMAILIVNDENISKIVRIALFHYLIGYIHPFYDGNGRLSRFISSYLLKDEFNIFVALKLSYSIKMNKSKYYKAFETCNDFRNRGDLTYFVITFMEFIDDALNFTNQEFTEAFAKMKYYIGIIFKSNFDSKKMAILVSLAQAYAFSNNELYFTELLEATNINETTLRDSLQSLKQEGLILKRREGKRYIYSLDVNQLK